MLEEVKEWLPLIVLILQLLLAWGMWSINQKYVSKDECKTKRTGVASSLSTHESEVLKEKKETGERIKVVEKEVAKLPDRKEVQDLNTKIELLSKEMGTLNGRLGGINRAVDLLNQHHINNS